MIKVFVIIINIVIFIKHCSRIQKATNHLPSKVQIKMSSKREEEKEKPSGMHRSSSGMKQPTKFIQRKQEETKASSGASQLTATASFTDQNKKQLGQSIVGSTENSDQTNSSYFNQSDDLPQVMNMTPLPPRTTKLASSVAQTSNQDDLLVAPITDQERNSIVESNFLSNNGDVQSAATGTTTAIMRTSSPMKPHAMSLVTPTSPTQKSSRKKAGAASIRASIAAISGIGPNDKDTVKVVIRVRPINEREKAGGPGNKVKLCLSVEGNQKIILDRGQEQKTFNFDYVALQESEQHELFDKIAKPIADSCLMGYNGTIFAYGQTGSGKTFTIQGPTMQINGEETLIGASNTGSQNYEKRGIMQRSFEYMFECMEAQKQEAKKNGIEMQFLVKSSYLEIYNEQVMDLLDPSSYNLHVREDIKKGVYVESLLEETVTSVKDMMNLTTRGARNRHVGSTMMNKESSRSHSVLTTTIESKTMNEEGVWKMKSSRFHIIDLAGSERSKATQAQGERLKEAGMINKSLTALGIVINSLVEISEGKNRHVHYRDSKLTFLLRDSLGGNSKTVIIANVTAAAISVGETLSTLNFAQRAKLIKNKAVVNEESSSTIAHLKQELRRVKKDLAEQTNLLKIAHEQLSLQPAQNEEAESNAICKVCQKDIAQQNNIISQIGTQEEDGVSLNFKEANFASNTSINLNDFGTNNIMDSSLELQLGTPSNSTPGTNIAAIQNNPKLLRQFKQRGIEHQAMKERVSKVERLLAENLENMDFQQKQYEQQINTLTKSNKDRQTALEASEKNRSRETMIIKFREDRIKELEARVNQLENDEKSGQTGHDCQKCNDLTRQLADAQREISQWLEVADKNPLVAKLQTENTELKAQSRALQAEIKVTPDSLTARVRGLNDMTNNLNSYLKEYCMGQGLDQLVQKLEASNQEQATKIETLESSLAEKESQHTDKIRSLSDDHEAKTAALTARLEQFKQTYESEKLRLEQDARDQMTRLKADLDASQAEKGALQKDIFDKVEAQMRQQEFQRSIEQLTQTVSELKAEKQTLSAQIKIEKDQNEKMADFQRKAEASKTESIANLQEKMDSEMSNLTCVLKETAQKANQEIQDLEKEVATIKEENRMHEESSADLDRKLRQIKLENDSLQKQVLETNEEMEEKRRHVREVESKLNQTLKELQSKNELLESIEQSQKVSMGQMRSQEEGKSKQLGELNAQMALLQAESSTKISGLESKITQLNQTVQEQAAQISSQSLRMTEMEQNEKSLKGIVSITDSKVEECARFEVERQFMQKKIEVLNQEVSRMTEQMSQAAREKAQAEVLRAQASAQEQLTVQLQGQIQEKDSEMSKLRRTITEKDLEIAKALRDLDQNSSQFKQSQSSDQEAQESLKVENTNLKQQLNDLSSRLTKKETELSQQIEQLQIDLSAEQEKSSRESKKFEKAKSEQSEMAQAVLQAKEEFKQEFQKETQKQKFALELDYQTKMQNRENELRNQYSSVQPGQDQQVQSLQQELHKSKLELYKLKQAHQLALVTLQGQIQLLKQQHQEFVTNVKRELTWKRVGPKIDVIKGIAEQVKLVSQEQATLRQYQLDCRELKEQLAEYKGLTQQLQEEKLFINKRLQENLSFVEQAKASNSEIIKQLQEQLQASQSSLLDAQKALRAYQRNSIAAEGPAKSTEFVEKLQNENKSQKEMLLKQENEIKEIVLTLKSFSEEKKQLQMQLQQATQSPTASSPQVNSSNATFGNVTTEDQQPATDEKSRKELKCIIDTITRLAENLLKLPGIAQFVGSNPQLKSHFTKHTIPQNNSTSSATYYATQKIKGIATVINHIFQQLQGRAQECDKMTVEFKRMESEIQRLQLAQVNNSNSSSPSNI